MDPGVVRGYFLMGCTDKRSARSALDRDPNTVYDTLSLMRRFQCHERTLAVERRLDSVTPQANRD